MNWMLVAWLLLAAPLPSLSGLIERQANRQLGVSGQVVRVKRVFWPSGRPWSCDPRRVKIFFTPREDFSGRSSVRVHQGHRQRWLTVEFERLVRTAVASRRLQRGAVLGPGDVELRRVPLARLGGREPLQPQQLWGRRLRRSLSSGAVLRPDCLERPLLVRRGDRVRLRVRMTGLLVEVAAEALASGRAGDRIPVKNLESGKRVQGRLQEGPVVTVELPSREAGGGP
ncbi:MAG: flagella basal body P-ring formation protein FlgA [Deltaproteobacteria bacterium]|nr:MAG: flagella basal body P-ring formation protein FlgA [Deltaproteobacteria bacterium]